MKQITCNFCGDTYPDFDVAHACSRGPYAHKLKPRMNERIRQLAEQVYGTQATEQEIKFAELIVRECMNAVCDPSTTYLESMTNASAMYTARERIRKHFRS
jgi:hypothetical protein